jgi:flagellar hook-associated protein FlgK
VDISDKISGGQLHGWLEIQDEVLPKYQTELDGLAQEFAWAVNQVHSQGVGLEYFSGTVTGAYATDPSGLLTTLPMGDKVDTAKDFKMWIQDNRTSPPVYDAVVIELDSDYWTLDDFATAFNAAVSAQFGGPVVAASVADNRLVFSAQSGDYRFAFGDDGFDDSGLAAALGFNTFFAGEDAAGISVNALLADKSYIAAARIDAASGAISAGDNRNALALADVQHDTCGIVQWSFARGSAATATEFTSTLEGFHGRMVGSMGLQALRFYQSQESAGLMVNSLQQQRDSVSAVSLDEEMINLIKYQQAYTAASKLLSVSDEMLIALINSR